MEKPESELSQHYLDTIVEECLEEEGIVDLLEGKALRDFAGLVLNRIRQDDEETDIELDQDFIEMVKESIMKWNGPGSPKLPEELRWNPLYELDDKDY